MKTRRAVVLGIAALLLSTVIGALAVQAVSEQQRRAPVLPSSESGAIAHFALANAQALSWDPDAVLVRVGATEGPQVDGRIDPPFLWDTSADPVYGNGAAVVWTFGYWAPGRHDASFWVAVGGDGSLLYARELANPYSCCVDYVAVAEASPTPPRHAHGDTSVAYSEPVYVAPAPRALSATIDAPAALAAVLDRPEFVNFSLDHPVFMTSLELVPSWEQESGSLWLVGYRTATYYGAGAAVDAQTGEVLHVGAWPRYVPPCCDPIVVPPPPPPQPPEPCCRPQDFHDTFTGTMRTGFDVGFPVDAAAWLQELRVVATVQGGSTPFGDEYALQLMDSNGRMLARVPGAGTSTLEVVLTAVPASGPYTAQLVRPQTQTVYVPGMDLVRSDAPVEIAVDVLYAETPQSRPLEYTFFGDVWSGGESWVGLYAEGQDWRPLVARTLALTVDIPQPGSEVQLAITDNWGNDIAVATTGTMASGPWTIALEVPETGFDRCCFNALVRWYPATQVVVGGQSLPYTLDVAWAEWMPEEMTHEGHEAHAEHEAHAGDEHGH